jgi:hypothetical protein
VTNGVFLIARDGGELARYLENAGFEIRELDRPPTVHEASSLVWLTERDDEPDVAIVEAWLDGGVDRRAIVVTWRKPALRALVDRFQDRLVVLAPPVFGYQLVDALRVL